VSAPIHLFAGYDKREAVGFHTFTHSVIEHANRPVSIIPLAAMTLPEGSNCFTVSRFLVAWLMGFQGHAIFCDASDMLCTGDIAELDDLFDPSYAIQVVKHPDYKTRHRTKYRGTDMECPNLDYPMKNWASVFICNAAHPHWREMTPANLRHRKPLDLLSFDWTDAIGELPAEWNRLVDEGHDYGNILHWTAGIPSFAAYHDAPFAGEWREAHARSQRGKE
jgi:hypothetical protein